jgi:hypothetical protein
MAGITETKEVFATLLKFVEAFRKAQENDGMINFSDIGFFVDPIVSLPTAINGIQDIPFELEDLEEEEITELAAQFGDIVDNEEYQEAFFFLVSFLNSMKNILKGE